MQRKQRRDPLNQILKITYLRYRNHCNNLVKKLKRKYERDLLAKSMNNKKSLWKNIKLFTYTNKTKSQNSELINTKPTPLEATEYVNQYFTNIGKKLAQKIQSRLKEDPEVYLKGLKLYHGGT